MDPVVAQSPSSVLGPYATPLQQLAVVLAVLLSWYVARRLAGGALFPARRERLLLGVPWGTLVVVLLVTAVYVFVQGAGLGFGAPTVIPFRAWSYYYPTGILLSGFSHSGYGHLLNNLVGTVTLGVVAEYAWGHYPRRRGAQTFTSWRTNPFARAGAFVLGTIVVGVLTGVFVLGPAIGFSGVVFAFAGYALTRYPLWTVLAMLAGNVVSLVRSALRSPVVTESGREAFVTPWWSSIAIQGHALGLFIGALLGAYVVRSRGRRPSAARLWAGVLLFVVARGLYAVYLPVGGGRYTLFRAVGTAAMFLLAGLLAGAVLASDRALVGRVAGYDLDLQSREVAAILLAALAMSVAFVAVPYNLFTVADAGAGVTEQNSVEVRDYTVFYAEGVPDQYVASVDLFGDATRVNASGVFVVSEARNIWWNTHTASRVAFDERQGRRTAVRVGGVGWSEVVYANRTTWSVVGNHSVYTVHVEHDEVRKLAYTSDPSTAGPTIDDRNVTVVPGQRFGLWVTQNNTTVGRAAVPPVNGSVTTGGLTFVREETGLYAVRGGTRVRVAARASGD